MGEHSKVISGDDAAREKLFQGRDPEVVLKDLIKWERDKEAHWRKTARENDAWADGCRERRQAYELALAAVQVERRSAEVTAPKVGQNIDGGA